MTDLQEQCLNLAKEAIDKIQEIIADTEMGKEERELAIYYAIKPIQDATGFTPRMIIEMLAGNYGVELEG